MSEQMNDAGGMWRITHGGEVRVVPHSQAMDVAGELVAKYGAGVPKFEQVVETELPGLIETLVLASTTADEGGLGHLSPVTTHFDDAVTPVPPSAGNIRGTTVDAEGAARSQADFDAAVAAGFSPKQTIYTRGTMVVSDGVTKARQFRQAFDKMPLVSDYCTDFRKQIADENRTDLPVLARELKMDDSGNFVLPEGTALAPTYGALAGLCTRLGYNGAPYLAKCDPELRAENVNYWREKIAGAEEASLLARAKIAAEKGKPEPVATSELQELVVRVRRNPNGTKPEAFGVVTPSYTKFDVDQIAEVLSQVTHAEARGTVTYDGAKARFTVLFHSNVQPENYVCGEFFRAGMTIGTDDIGSGSIWGRSVAEQNLCLNLIILDRAAQDLFRIRHIGSAEELEKLLRAGYAKGEATLAHFIRQWGYACREDVLVRTAEANALTQGDDVPMTFSEALPGLFNGILERQLVMVPGRKVEIIPKLVKAWQMDESGAKLEHGGLTRASLVNAFTRLAHEEPFGDPWAEDEIQAAASRLLWGKGEKQPAPIPYVSLAK